MAEIIRKFLFPLYLLIILLDLNEFVTKNLDSEAVLTNAILGLSFFLLVFSKPKYSAQIRTHRSFLFALVAFCFVGAIAAILDHGTQGLVKEIRHYIPSFIIYLVAFRVLISQRNKEDFADIVHFITLFIGINGILILVSIFFNYDFHKGSISSVERAVGLYSNANRAGYVSALGQAFAIFMILSEHKRKRGIYILIYLISLAAAMSTFSKGATLVSILLVIRLIYFLNQNRYSIWKQYKKYVRILLFLVVLGAGSLVLRYSALEGVLSEEQMYRLNTLELLVQGNINEETTSHRTEIGSYAWNKIKENPIIGYGIGEFHKLDIGYGTHNIYLLIWGESGIIGILAYVIFLVTWFVVMRRHRNTVFKMLTINVLIIIAFSGFAAHTLLVNKPYLLIYGTLFGGMSIYTERRRRLQER